MNDPIRLSKRVIELTGCSRSQAEQYIEGGWVKVAGQVVEKPQFLVHDELVEIDPQAQPAPVEPATILLHRPALDPRDPAVRDPVLDPAGRSPDDRSGIRQLQRHLHHLTPLVPLEPRASGIVVLTQNEGLARKMQHDEDRIEQEFLVEVSGEIIPDGLGKLARGLIVNGQQMPPLRASWQSENRLRFALKDVRPGQFDRVCAALGLRAEAVKRVRLGRVPLARLPLGQWRYLTAHERI